MPNNTNQTIPVSVKQPEKKPKGSGYTNLQSVLDANKKNKLSGAVTGQVSEATDLAKQNLASQQQKFSSDLSQARSAIQQQKEGAQKVLGRFDVQPEDQFQDTTSEEEQQFANLRGAKYTGPTGLQNAQMIQDQAARAAALGQLAGSRLGRQELLKSAVSNTANYTPTKQRLDELILSLGGNQKDLQQAAGESRRLGQQIGGAVKSAELGGKQAAGELDAVKQDVSQGITSRHENIDAKIKSQLEDLKNKVGGDSEQARQFQAALGRGDYGAAMTYAGGLLAPEDVSALQSISQYASAGLSAGLANRFNLPTGHVTMGNAATDQQRAMENALARLAGGQQQYLDPKEALTPGGFGNINDLVPQIQKELQFKAARDAANKAFAPGWLKDQYVVPRGEEYKAFFERTLGGTGQGGMMDVPQFRSFAQSLGVNSDAELIQRYYTDPNFREAINTGYKVGPYNLGQYLLDPNVNTQAPYGIYGSQYAIDQLAKQAAIKDFLAKYAGPQLMK